MKTKVFLSWSKDRSRKLAGVLRDWIPKVIQAVDPWVSDVDIEAGTFWDAAIQKSIQEAKFCIVCVTPENYQSPWLNYESGALADGLKQKVAPYLLGAQMNDLQSSPLARLQANECTAEGTLKVLSSLNTVLADPLPESTLKESFEVHWPKLERELEALSEQKIQPTRSPEEKIDEVLVLLQGMNQPELLASMHADYNSVATAVAEMFDKMNGVLHKLSRDRWAALAINFPGIQQIRRLLGLKHRAYILNKAELIDWMSSLGFADGGEDEGWMYFEDEERAIRLRSASFFNPKGTLLAAPVEWNEDDVEVADSEPASDYDDAAYADDEK